MPDEITTKIALFKGKGIRKTLKNGEEITATEKSFSIFGE